ncbi:restriction endonuclease subunit S [Mitsuokella jalaludinii]|uniref:restriction endonuclease subunit S n=1 Tax=Mitsuokella jalaludinii TaxID=187979 RepID=UPI00243333D7|nr:restriction endonuclease subunit S [Mitsuokella jalaludinii]
MKYKLSDICKYAKGKIKVSALDDNTYISTENMLPNKGGITKAVSLPTQEQTQAFMKNDVLVSNIRPYFKKIWYATFDGGCSNDVLVFRAKDGVSSRFLHYVLADDTFFDYSMATSKGTKMPRGDKKAIMEYEVPELSYEDQCRIAGILEVIDEKIELNTDINKNLEQQADALYQAFFSPKSGIEGEISTLDKYCAIFTGKKNANASVEGGAYKFFTCAPDSLQINSYIYDGNAIIVSGNGAYTGRTRFYSGKFDLYQRTYACTMLNGINPDYIFPLYWFVKLELSKKIMGGTRGSAIPYIVMNDLAKFEFIYNKESFDFYMPLFKVLTESIQANEAENETLSLTRDLLLPQLMSGEIDVSDINL